MNTPAQLHIDLVSDVACPWCAVGLWALDQALAQLQGEVEASIHPQPFELNPHMGPEGEDITEHLGRKYGSTPEQQAQIRDNIRQRGAQVGFAFKAEGRGRIWNTLDAHRLLHWATAEGAAGQALTSVRLSAKAGAKTDAKAARPRAVGEKQRFMVSIQRLLSIGQPPGRPGQRAGLSHAGSAPL